jgi:hypothetical protein
MAAELGQQHRVHDWGAGLPHISHSSCNYYTITLLLAGSTLIVIPPVEWLPDRKFRAGILCTIPNFELGYCVLSQDMYWYILRLGANGSGFGPKTSLEAATAPVLELRSIFTYFTFQALASGLTQLGALANVALQISR